MSASNIIKRGLSAATALFSKITDGTNTLPVAQHRVANNTLGILMLGHGAGTVQDEYLWLDSVAADGRPTTALGLRVQGILYGWNGTTFDRIKSVNTGQVVVTQKDSSGNETPAGDAAARGIYNRITDGTDNLGINANGRVNIIEGNNYAASGSITSGTTTVDINAALGRNANAGFIANDGPGAIQVEISYNGTDYGTAFNINSSETLPLNGLSVDTIKLTWVANSSYRVVAW